MASLPDVPGESEDETEGQRRLRDCVAETKLLDNSQQQTLVEQLCDHHTAFSLDKRERGEMDLVEFQILTGDRVPFPAGCLSQSGKKFLDNCARCRILGLSPFVQSLHGPDQ